MKHRKALSKYQRKQMTPEEIDQYENTDDNGNYLEETIERGEYTIEIWRLKIPIFGFPYKVVNDYRYNDEIDMAETRHEANGFVADMLEDIDIELEDFTS